MDSVPSAMEAVMRQYDLSLTMVDAIFSGDEGDVLDCKARTEDALVQRGIMHPTESVLTDKGKEVLNALAATLDVVEAPALKVIEGTVVTHTGTTKGSLPKHSEHPDVIDAVHSLGTLKLAELTDHFEPGQGEDVRGFMVEPRGNGRVAVYWVFGGRLRNHDDKPFKVELSAAEDKLRYAGWRVEPGPSLCVFAWRTAAVVPRSTWTQLPMPVKAGDLVEAKTATRNGEPKTIRVRADREPWLINKDSAVISDGTYINSVFTDTIRVINETAQPVAVLPTQEESAAAARAFFTTPAPEVLHEEVTYQLQTRQPGGDWQHMYTAHAAETLDEAQETIDDLKTLSGPGWEYRPVEIRRTLTALPHQPAPAADVKPGLVRARKLRSGYTVRFRGKDRLVWKVTFNLTSRILRVYMVPPVGKDPELFAFSAGVNDHIELLAVGPSVGMTGQLLGTAH